jgi:DNA-binding MarR family transcriptional regulator
MNVDATSTATKSELAKYLYETRRLREKFLPPDLFAEPAWDILLLLYWAGESGQRMSISAVCCSAGVPETTAQRWIQKLLETGMLNKEPHPTDLRVSWLTLSAQAKASLEEYLSTAADKRP